MAVGYRSILRLPRGQNAVTVAEDQLRLWLREKSRGRNTTLECADWDGAGVHRLGPSAELRVVYEEHAQDRSVRRLYRLVETNATGKWVVSVYAASLPSSREYQQTIVVDVDRSGVEQTTALATVDPPKVVRSLLDTVSVSDGSTVLTGAPVIVRAGQITDVVKAICDPERTASVVVAGSFMRELDDDWKDAVTSLTKQSVGVAATYVVYADAMAELDAALPESHRVGAGRVRTYLPRADLTDPTDSVRHKWLGPATLQRSLTGKTVSTPLQRRHAEVARRRFVEAELPSDVRRTIDLLRRAETGMERAARVAERIAETKPDRQPNIAAMEAAIEVLEKSIPASVGVQTERPKQVAAAWHERAKQAIQRWLGVVEPEAAHLDNLDNFIAAKVAEVEVAEEQLIEAAVREEELHAELQRLRSQFEDRELDLAQAEQDEIESQRELALLRQRLAASASPDTYVPPDDDDWGAPDTIEELVSRITPGKEAHAALTYVEFTGNAEVAIEIDRRYPSGLYAKTLWQYVRVLHDFAEARATQGFSGNVHMYLTDDHTTGTKCSPNRHAANESQTVLANPSWRQERVLPVPPSVSVSGSALMVAHFKPTHKDTFAPRMHYLDDLAKSGKVYIGYIGKHLTNKQT